MDIFDVAASLSLGQLYSRRRVIAFYTLLIAGFTIGLLSVVFAILQHTAVFEFGYSLYSDNLLVIIFVVLAFAGFIVGVMGIVAITKNNKVKIVITQCIEDSVLLKAYSKKLDSVKFLFLQDTLIEVSFNYDERNYIKTSKGNMLGQKQYQGYHRAFSKYADREINILYSPKHDEVLILKSK